MIVRRILLALCLLCALLQTHSHAGVMTHEALQKKFPSPWMIGQKDDALPVWPVFKQNATATELVGYLFESADFAAIPGFAGVPINLLIALDAKGGFLDVSVLSQHEPVFLDGLGEEPLHKFVSQYRGLSLKDNIAIDTPSGDRGGRGGKEGGSVHIDGVAKATASVRIINQSILSAALKVARKKLAFSGTIDPDRIARIRQDINESMDIASLTDTGLFKRFVPSNGDVERAFAGSNGAGLDEEARARPDEAFVEMRIALASVPSIGRNLLDDASWNRLSGRLENGDHAVLVWWRGRYGPVSQNFVEGTTPDRLTLSQAGLPIEMRDLNLELRLREESALPAGTMKVFRVISHAGLDPSQPLDLSLHVTRLKGMMFPEKIVRDFGFTYRLPERFYTLPASDDKSLLIIWKQRWLELAVIGIALAVLFVALARYPSLVASEKRFSQFRLAYLMFTLVFLGWYAQGQLSIVNLTGALHALKEGRGLGFMLYDPVSILIWGAVLLSLFLWGRGTFCGWLCPFGALQEFAGKLGQILKLPQLRLRRQLDARLKLLKYGILAVILASVFISPGMTDKLVELEPFKTAITLNFVRSWPYVLYAAALLAASAVFYKFFCRYLCPFGAAVAVLGRVRMFSWLPRREQCGKPCQTCRYRCSYDAIRDDGSIRYDDCFQCMDCVVIYQSDDKCAPLILEKKRRTSIPIKVA